MEKAVMQPPLHPTSGPAYRPVVTLNGWSLPWRMNGDWKEFHLVAEPVVRAAGPAQAGAGSGDSHRCASFPARGAKREVVSPP